MLIENGLARIEEAYNPEIWDEFIKFSDEHGQVILITHEAAKVLIDFASNLSHGR